MDFDVLGCFCLYLVFSLEVTYSRAVYPFLQSFSYSGELEFGKKIIGAVKENLIFYGVGGIIYIGILIFILVTNGLELYRFMFD